MKTLNFYLGGINFSGVSVNETPFFFQFWLERQAKKIFVEQLFMEKAKTKNRISILPKETTILK